MKLQNQWLFDTPLDLSRRFDRFEIDLELEKVGGIPKRDYLRWIQFSLNMYFKKTALHPSIVEDGVDTKNFRNAVEFFNERATGRKNNREIDKKTQNKLIFANEQNSGYLNWLKTQLNKLGYAPLTINYGANEKPTSAIVAFQKTYDGTFGFSLKPDGFVGAKTHLALLHAIKRLKPKLVKPSASCELCNLVQTAPVDELATSKHERERLLCLRDFIAEALKGKKVDDRYWTYPFETLLGQILPCSYVGQKNSQGISFKNKRTIMAIKRFKHMVGDSKDKQTIAKAIKRIHDDILCQLNSLSYAVTTALGESPNRWESPECVEARMLLAQSVKHYPESIFKCFRKLLLSSFSATCNLPRRK
ncbi:MAG: hypothetical protein SAK29_04765 [Scytonema sp. PMC 1069.18]|nr:hypothetical protein [Scytonema sp. PMC 1069.18]MEC4881084.1 hypothetical protein [Scytonema sp. PMC 1070.18]